MTKRSVSNQTTIKMQMLPADFHSWSLPFNAWLCTSWLWQLAVSQSEIEGVFLYVGMKKEYILSEEEKKQKKQKIEENRVRKHQKQQLNRKAGAASCIVNNSSDSGSGSPTHNGSQSPRSDVVLSRPHARVLPSSRHVPHVQLIQVTSNCKQTAVISFSKM